MANYFLASVGVANAFVKKNIGGQSNLYHAFTAKTLTESTLGFTSTQDDIRAGQGAKLYGRFSHDTGMTVSLTDAMFKLEYLAMQIGAEIDSANGAGVMYTEQVEVAASATSLTLSKPVVAMGKSCGLDKTGVWYRLAGCEATDDFTFVEVEAGSESVTIPAATAKRTFCVTYFANEAGAREMLVNANFIPAEMILILTTKLFAGDASNPETGKPVGEITIKVPRFQLDGAIDLSMAMSSAATISLNGTALAVDSEGCDSDGIYAEIVEVIKNRKWDNGLAGFAEDPDTGDLVAIYNGGFTTNIDKTAGATFDPVFAISGNTITVNGKTFTIIGANA